MSFLYYLAVFATAEWAPLDHIPIDPHQSWLVPKSTTCVLKTISAFSLKIFPQSENSLLNIFVLMKDPELWWLQNFPKKLYN